MDATRGVALLAMVLAHVLPPFDPDGTVSVPHLVVSGRAAATFAVLAGVGLALADGGWRRANRRWPAAAAGTAARAVVIGTIGLLLGEFDSGVAVILSYSALLFVLAVPLMRLSARVLAVLAVAAALVVPVVSHLVRAGLPEASGDNPTLGRLVQEPLGVVTELALTGYYPALPWLTYLCAGLAVGRLALRSRSVATAVFGVGLGLAVTAPAVSWILLGPLGGGPAIVRATPGLPPDRLDQVLASSQYGVTPTDTWWWLAVDGPHSATPLDLLHTTGTALALLGAVLLLGRVGRLVRLLLSPLAALGGMTLTLYTAHVLLLASPVLPTDPGMSYAVQVAAAVAIAVLWRCTRRRGPLEALVALASGAARRAAGGRPVPPRAAA